MSNLSSFVNLTLNSTIPVRSGLHAWQLTQFFQIAIGVISLLFNIPIWCLLVTTRELRTPFNIYVTNLVSVNIIYGVCQAPFEVYSAFHRTWHIGTAWCSFFLYWVMHLQPYLYWSHAIISLNRLWAVVSPLTYRNLHTRRVAIQTCLSVMLFVHVVHLPMLLRDIIWYRLPEDIIGCQPNGEPQGLYGPIAFMLLNNLPLLIVLLVYPFIAYKQVLRRREQQILLGRKSGFRHSFFSLYLYLVTLVLAAALTLARSNTRDVGQLRSELGTASQVLSGVNTNQVGSSQSKPATKKSNGFLIVTLLTFTCAVSFVPINLFYNFQNFRPEFLQNNIYTPFIMLASLEAVFDPIYFIIAMQDLRKALDNLMSFR